MVSRMKEIEISEKVTIEDLIKHLDLNLNAVIFSVNGRIVYPGEEPKRELK